MTRPRSIRHARRGFTLVELMVATALVILILTILAVAFGASSESLLRLRALGEMSTGLDTAHNRLRADLEAPHFEGGTPNQPDSPGVMRLKDLRYDRLGSDPTVRPPDRGFFRIEQGSGNNNGSIFEGWDAEGLTSTRAVNHALDFTVKREGNSPDDLFVVPATTGGQLPPLNATDTPLNTTNQFVTKWARVRWYLDNPQTVEGVQVWTLYRCSRVIAPGNVNLSATEQEQVAHTGGISRTPAEMVNPVNRPAIVRYQPGTPYFGDDIVLSNVTSFEVKPTWDAGGVRGPRANWPIANNAYDTPVPDGIPGVGGVPSTATPNGDFPYDDLPLVTPNDNPALVNQRVFDTWAPLQDTAAMPPTSWNNHSPPSPLSLPLRMRVTSLQIKIRVFDPKSLLSRQLSFFVHP